MQNSNAANRLDRLPISRFHKVTLVAVSFAYFFEFADINTFATTAPRLLSLWGVSINQVAYVTSLSFVGMFLGSVVAGSIADRWGRKNALTLTTLFFGFFSFASVFSWDLVSLGACRILTSAGLAAMTVVAFIYISDRSVRGRGTYRHLDRDQSWFPLGTGVRRSGDVRADVPCGGRPHRNRRQPAGRQRARR